MSRAIAWARRHTVEQWLTFVVVAGCVAFLFWQLHPELLLRNTTPNGGDMGAHVWGPAYLRDELLPRFRLTGWTPDWYAGFPAYQFYMVVPSLFVVILDALPFVSYNVAFKLVTVSGVLGMPIAAWAMARMSRLPFPTPAAFAVATVPFLFERSYSIFGGNILSTLAGEFAFTISLCFALLFIGALARVLDEGRGHRTAGVLLGLCVLCHLIPAVFALVSAAVMLQFRAFRKASWNDPRTWVVAEVCVAFWLAIGLLVAGAGLFVALLPAAVLLVVEVIARRMRSGGTSDGEATAGEGDSGERDGDDVAAASPVDPATWRRELRRRVTAVAFVVVLGGLLSAVLTVPFVLRRAYLNDMGWEKVTNYWELLFAGPVGRSWSRALGGAGNGNNGAWNVPGDQTWVVVLAFVGVGVSLLLRRRFGTQLAAIAFVLALGVRFAPQGRLWNARLLPFWYLCLYLLAALAVVEIIAAVLTAIRTTPANERALRLGAVGMGTLVVLAIVAFPLRALPFGSTDVDASGVSRYSWLGLTTTDRSGVPAWVKWNYEGYEGKDVYSTYRPDQLYPEYKAVVDTMGEIGQEEGCGRAMWEYEPQLDRYGTPMALMLLPYWTDGCIGSMEGVYFEASATTPYHFLNQSELSKSPSRPQRDLPYGELNVDLGVQHLQLLGVKYYMAFSDTAVQAAEGNPDLTFLEQSGPWRIYEVAGSELVEPLPNEPAVVEDVPKGGREWLEMALPWYLDPSQWDVMLAADGPSDWQRIAEGEQPVVEPTEPATVSDIQTDADTISFDVDQVGTPVLVKASYFPNWRANGADGPYRVAPNLMVVVPTSEHVTLEYGRTPVDLLGLAMTGVGLAIVLSPLFLRRRRAGAPARPAASLAAADVEDRVLVP